MRMANHKILSLVILFGCVLLSAGIVIAGYQQFQDIGKAQESINEYKERMSKPVDALDPNNVNYNSMSAQIIIPKLNVNASIRSDTVNAYNAVYHYYESVMPGKPGECGILGHRTTYSGLFKNIASLKPGDQAIIKDYLQHKQFVYEVTSNGNDIRWDYKTNPVRFAEEGEPRLLIITCYPPGKKQAAWITHFKLISTSDL